MTTTRSRKRREATERQLLEVASKGYHDLVNQVNAGKTILKELNERSLDKAKGRLMQELKRYPKSEGMRERLFLLNQVILSMVKTEREQIKSRMGRYEAHYLQGTINNDDATKIMEGLLEVLPSGMVKIEVRVALNRGSEGLKDIERDLRGIPKDKRNSLFLTALLSSSLKRVEGIIKEQNACFDQLRKFQALKIDEDIPLYLKQIEKLYNEERKTYRPALKHFCQKVILKGPYRDYEIEWFSPRKAIAF